MKLSNDIVPLLCIIGASLIAIISAYFDFRNKLKAKNDEINKEVKRSNEYQNIIERSNTILEKSNKIMTYQQVVIDTSTKIIKLQKQLAIKSIQLEELQSITLQNVTGGKSVPSLEIIVAGNQTVNIAIRNDHPFPVKNVSLRLQILLEDKFEKDSVNMFVARGDSSAILIKKIDVGDLPINSSKEIFNEPLSLESKKYFYIYHVVWMNGSYLGGFRIDGSQPDNFKIEDSKITFFPKGIDLNKAVWINGKFAEVVEDKNK